MILIDCPTCYNVIKGEKELGNWTIICKCGAEYRVIIAESKKSTKSEEEIINLMNSYPEDKKRRLEALKFKKEQPK